MKYAVKVDFLAIRRNCKDAKQFALAYEKVVKALAKCKAEYLPPEEAGRAHFYAILEGEDGQREFVSLFDGDRIFAGALLPISDPLPEVKPNEA